MGVAATEAAPMGAAAIGGQHPQEEQQWDHQSRAQQMGAAATGNCHGSASMGATDAVQQPI